MDMYDARPVSTLLKRSHWFDGLPLDLQARILAGARSRSFAKGEVIGLEGRQPGALMVVLTGLVRLVRQARHGDEALLYICEPGFWFGEYAVLTGEPALVGVIAKSKVRLLVLSKAEFDRIVEAEPRYYRYFAALALTRMAIYLKAFIHSSSLTPEWRLKSQLTLLSRLKMDEQGVSAPFELPYSQADLASIVGVSRQTMNGLLHELVNKGVIEVGFGRVRVLSPAALAS
jgi:CRP/FNR family transcriptional regulator, cyclic AMP receptor protein